MITGTIQLTEAHKIMKTGSPFSISFVQADRRRGRAGRWVELDKCILSGFAKEKPSRKDLVENQVIKPALVNPNLIENDTINIFNLNKQAIITVHLRLIKYFNGKNVVY